MRQAALAILFALPKHAATWQAAASRVAGCAAPTRYRFTAHANVRGSARFEGLAARAADDIWAVDTEGTHRQALIAHWNGRSWKTIASAHMSDSGPRSDVASALSGVAAIARDDVWAIGLQDAEPIIEHWDLWNPAGSGVSILLQDAEPIIEHWDGTRWRVVDVAVPPTSYLSAVAAIPAGDVWVVGEATQHVVTMPLLEHWDGRDWATAAEVAGVKTSGATSYFESVAATSRGDVWAVGAGDLEPGTLIEHWDGRRWHLFPLPGAEPVASVISVLALTPSDAWIAGEQSYHYNNSGDDSRALLAHWDGRSWRIVRTPDAWKSVRSLVATSRHDIWGLLSSDTLSLLVHWDGRRWKQAAATTPDSPASALVAPAPGSVWVAGAALSVVGRWQMDVPEIDHYLCTPASHPGS